MELDLRAIQLRVEAESSVERTRELLTEAVHKYTHLGATRFLLEDVEGLKTGDFSLTIDALREKHATQIKRNKTNLEKTKIPDDLIRAGIESQGKSLYEALGIKDQAFDLSPTPIAQSKIGKKDLEGIKL